MDGVIKCDNCLGNHFIPDFVKERYQEDIKRNKAARGGGPGCGRGRGRGVRGVGRTGGHAGRGRSGGGGCNGRFDNNSDRGARRKPSEGEEVCIMKGQSYAACKHCGRKDGSKAHTNGACDASRLSGYAMRTSLSDQMGGLSDRNWGDTTPDPASSGQKKQVGVNISSAMIERSKQVENSSSDPDLANFAVQFTAFFDLISKE